MKLIAPKRKPRFEGEVIKNLTCELCGKKHGWIKAERIQDVLSWTLHSPCLDKLCQQAIGMTNKILTKKERRQKND